METPQVLELEDFMAVKMKYCLIDVRTQSEFSQGSIPGSINIPFFNEIEREAIGKVYARNQVEAKYLAMDFAAPKIPHFVRCVDNLCQGKPVIVICWRGGMRSHAITQFLNLAGARASQLRGGYHNYRRNIYRQLIDYKLKSQLIVLAGKSGTGKTKILSLISKQGYPVLDLEDIAGHKGSNFGDVGKSIPQCQKNFDSLLLDKLKDLGDHSPIYLEGESRRIGKIILPEFLYKAMKEAPTIEIVGSLEARTDRILKDYTPNTSEDRISLYLALYRLKGRLPRSSYASLRMNLDREGYRQFVQSILTGYYDKRYGLNDKKRVFTTVNSDDIHQAVEKILRNSQYIISKTKPRLKD